MKKSLKITALVTVMAITSGVFCWSKREEAALKVVHAEDAVQYLNNKKIMTGDESGDLRLDDFVTRAEFAKMVCESDLLHNLPGETEDFPDVQKNIGRIIILKRW